MTSSVEELGAALARRFHELHEPLHARGRELPEVDWDDMPESYRRRLASTFELLVREGSVRPAGPFLRLGEVQQAIF